MESNARVFVDRLASILDGEVLSSWFKRIGVDPGVAKTIKRGSIPKAETLIAISDATGKSIDWLLGRDANVVQEISRIREDAPGDADDFVYIRWLNASGVALAVPRAILGSFAAPDTSSLVAYRVIGNAMGPTICDGDIVIAHVGVAPVTVAETPRDGIYLLSWREAEPEDGERAYIVRRILVDPIADRLRLVCDNPAYPTIEVKEGNGFLSVPGEKYDAVALVNRRLYGTVVAVLGAVT